MNHAKRLLPGKGAWVEHKIYGHGIVLQAMQGLDGASLKVRWNNQDIKAPSIVQLASVISGFRVGMEVQHIPARTEKSLGEGVILKTRVVAGFSQVLVYFTELSESRWVPFEALSWIKGVKHRFTTNDYGDESSPEKFRLKVLAHALEIWNENTGALSHMDIDPLPHQVHLVHHILSSGRLNWLIADDVGLGKTIETGMLLKALEQRDKSKRILLVSPAGLTAQWKDELHHKFGLSEFRIYGENFHIEEDREWKMYNHVIGSIDKFKDERHLELLLRAEPWDLIVFDEAHRLSRRQYGLKYDASQRFQLANRLRSRTKGMVLLSATPHQGMLDKFQSLLMLLEPDRKSDIETLSLNPEILSDLMIRNNKSDVTDAKGNFIFKGKSTRAVRIEGDATVRAFDASLRSYLQQGYRRADSLGQVGNAIGFVMTVYRKLAASSAKAIHNALLNRRAKITEQMEGKSSESLPLDERYVGEYEEAFSSPSNEFFDGELEKLEVLIEESAEVLRNDRKLQKFIDDLIPSILKVNSKEKLLIFTEYRSTQDYLHEALEKKFGMGCVDLINGSMKHPDRKKAINHFEEDGQFLISTEAGGEGINLQRTCHIMINFDLPWNPMRLVQRIGRLYRYGQNKRVVVFNLHSPESMDDQIMGLMYERIEQVVGDLASVSGEFNERLGEDILGEIADLIDIENILEKATSEGIFRTKERIEDALNKAKDAAGKQRELFEYAAGFNPDEVKSELTITLEHVMAFVEGMFRVLDVDVVDKTHRDLVWHIKIPEEMAKDLGVRKTRFEITFDRLIHSNRPQTEMMDLDNFILKYLLTKAKAYSFGGLSAVVEGANLQGNGILCTYLRWQNTSGERMRQELLAWQVNSDGSIVANSPEFGDWLKATTSHMSISMDKNTSKNMFRRVEIEAERNLQEKSNQWLHPEGMHPVAAAWLVR